MAAKRPSLADLRARMKKNSEKSNSGFYQFYNMKIGEQAVVRFLPDKNENNPDGFFVTKMSHKLSINGEDKNIPCRRQYLDENQEPHACPICELSQQYYKKQDKKNGGKYWHKKMYYANVLVVTDPLPADAETKQNATGTVQLISFSKKIYDAIDDAIQSGDIEELPDDFSAGTDFIIKKTQQGEYADYSRSKFAKHPSELDDDTIALVESSIIDLSTVIPADPGYDKVEAMLEAHLSGSTFEEGDEAEEGDKPRRKPAKPAADEDDDEPAPRRKPKPPVDEDDDPVPRRKPKPPVDDEEDDPAPPPRKKAPAPADDEDDEEAEALLATIRNRKAQ